MLTPFQSRAARSLVSAPFFGELGDDLIGVHRVAVRRGELLYEKGAPSDRLYGLISGQLKVFTAPEAGREISLDLIAPGELIGELAIIDGAPRHASVAALATSELAAIERCELARLLARRPELHATISAAAARSAARLAQRAEDTAFLSIERRLERALDDLAGRFGERVGEGIRIRLRQQDIADMLGVSRESVSRALSAEVRHGRIALGRGSIVVLG